MLWVFYALISAFTWATADAFTKKITNKVDDYILIWSRFLFAAPFLLLILFFIPIPKLDVSFWYVMLIILPLELVAWILYIKAIKISHLSLIMPFLVLTPVFTLLTSLLILGEFPNIIGLIGILFVVVGAYLLNIGDNMKGVLAPFKSIIRERGCVYMIIVAFIFSINANLSKVLVLKSSPLFYSAIFFPFLAVPFFIIVLFTSRKNIKQIFFNYKDLFIIGLFFGLMIITHMLAVPLVIIPYLMSIKRTSSIFSVLYGHFLFKEEHFRERLNGTIIMLAGAVLIILFS